MRKIIVYFLIISFALILTACGGGTVDDSHNNEGNNQIENDNEQPENDQTEEPLTLRGTADAIIDALHDRDIELLASFIHSEQGVRFTPYGYVDIDHDLSFSKDEVTQLMVDETVYTWGLFDGRGDPIEYTFAQYFDEFIYDADFAEADQVGINERIGQGNTIDNSSDIYPNASIVEYHFPGFDEELAGIDWKSLRLVLELDDGEWALVGVIHDEWTI